MFVDRTVHVYRSCIHMSAYHAYHLLHDHDRTAHYFDNAFMSHLQAASEATVIFGVKTVFGGGKSSCFALVYDSLAAAKTHEPPHRLIQNGHKEAAGIVVGRKQRKEKKNREKKFRGTKKEKRVRAAKA